MAEYTEKMTIAVSPALKAAIATEAKRQGRRPTALARYTLERVFLADVITVRQCADVPAPIDPEAEDRFLYPEKHRAGHKLVDSGEPFNAATTIIGGE